MQESLDYAQQNPGGLQVNIEENIVQPLLKKAERIGAGVEKMALSNKETKGLVEFFVESMRNHIHKVNELLPIFSKPDGDGNAYNHMQQDLMVVIPSVDNLAKNTMQNKKIREGDCEKLYSRHMMVQGYKSEAGELMCDAMKLKEDILINVASNEVVGCTTDFICKKKVMKKLLDDNEVKTVKTVKTYWYNTGSLDGDALLDQFRQVVLRCEIVGSRVLGFVCDAGGCNAHLMKLLRGNKSLPEGAWIPIRSVCTPNPYCPDSTVIYLFHCSTHDLKAMRNALFTSWTEKGTKQFLDEQNNRIRKAIVSECFQRDRIREINNQAPLSEVRESTVNLNKWSKMNASEAKRLFSLKTLCKIASHLYTEMNVTVGDRLSKEQNGPLGNFPAVATHIWTL
ncbi:LOW QUALITY PROTEIN: hypothetical protein ACHAWF_001986 [Thalassiosira exigua]